ncbi:MAG: 50S ribosomal protein L23 [Actinobacteria bacterium]|nr:50S ribosomal protein L23 [Actinomycetota bacterium]MBL7123778.1 50S ribosomal protein L23 [Actinomycetota bacterium]
MKDPRDIILSPIVSEKSYSMVQDRRYSFYIDIRAKKSEVKRAIEQVFNVKVLKISTINVKPKPKKLGRSIGKNSRKKKAVVTIGKKDKIEFFESV